MKKPLVAVSGPDEGGAVAWWFTKQAVKRAGGQAIRMTPSNIGGQNSRNFDALILGGGADVHPEHYGEERLEQPVQNERRSGIIRGIIDYAVSGATYIIRSLGGLQRPNQLDEKRDDFELRMLEHAFKNRIPVLGICRGAQLMNIFCGGSLYQNLQPFYAEDPEVYSVLPKKRVKVKQGSLLQRITGAYEMTVNSLHKQAANKIGEEITVTAEDSFGLVQAIEHASHPFFLGVQWHPEYMPQSAKQQALFMALIQLAGQRDIKE